MKMAFWEIQRNSRYDQFFLPFKMKVDGDFACTEFFFDFINAKILPDFIEALVKKHGYNNSSFAAVYFPSDMDGMDIANGLAIPDGFLRVSDGLAEKSELIDEDAFYKITVDYAESMMGFYNDSEVFGDSWRKNLLNSLTQLTQRIVKM